MKNAWFIAPTSVETMPTDFMRAKSGTRKKRSPSFAPGMKKLCTASATMMASNAIIMTLVTRSSPFCKPMTQTAMPSTTTTSIQNAIVAWLASISVNAAPTCSVLTPSSLPAAVR